MITKTSPITWTKTTMKIKLKLDMYIALKPDIREIPISINDYEILLKHIHPRDRHLYQKDLWYHGRKLLRGKR